MRQEHETMVCELQSEVSLCVSSSVAEPGDAVEDFLQFTGEGSSFVLKHHHTWVLAAGFLVNVFCDEWILNLSENYSPIV